VDIGRTLCERYVLERELGRGNLGAVFAGRDQLLEREVAVKLISLISETGDARAHEHSLRSEAKRVASLQHPGLIPIYDFGRDDDLLFLVMPLIAGRSLRELLDNGPLAIPMLAEIGRQAALALAYGHSRELVHRDIKPNNLLLTSDAEGLVVRLTDFGLAGLHEASDGSVGTPP
jgi:serine/threonine protein kinase